MNVYKGRDKLFMFSDIPSRPIMHRHQSGLRFHQDIRTKVSHDHSDAKQTVEFDACAVRRMRLHPVVHRGRHSSNVHWSMVMTRHISLGMSRDGVFGITAAGMQFQNYRPFFSLSCPAYHFLSNYMYIKMLPKETHAWLQRRKTIYC